MHQRIGDLAGSGSFNEMWEMLPVVLQGRLPNRLRKALDDFIWYIAVQQVLLSKGYQVDTSKCCCKL